MGLFSKNSSLMVKVLFAIFLQHFILLGVLLPSANATPSPMHPDRSGGSSGSGKGHRHGRDYRADPVEGDDSYDVLVWIWVLLSRRSPPLDVIFNVMLVKHLEQ